MEKEINYFELVSNYANERLGSLGLSSNDKYLIPLKKEFKDLKDWQEYGNVNMSKRLWNLKENNRHFDTNSSGSILLYLLDISSKDPIKENIKVQIEQLAEPSLPDIDTDFDPRCREWVKKRIVELFGEENTCSIGTYQKYRTKAVVLDVARSLGYNIHEINEITKPMSSLQKHENEEGEEEILDQMEWEDIFKLYPVLQEFMEANPEVLKHCKVLRNQVKNMGKHAGGMIISNSNVQNTIPIVKDKSGAIVSSFCESGSGETELSKIGLVKYDILGLCLEQNTLIQTNKGNVPIKYVDGLEIKYIDSEGNPQFTDEFLLISTGKKDLIKITLEDGSIIKCSPDHKLFIKN